MAKTRKPLDVQVRLTGLTGQVDGLMEMVVGMFAMTGVLLRVDKYVTSDGKGTSKIYLEIVMQPPPLGNLGEGDLQPYTGDNP